MASARKENSESPWTHSLQNIAAGGRRSAKFHLASSLRLTLHGSCCTRPHALLDALQSTEYQSHLSWQRIRSERSNMVQKVGLCLSNYSVFLDWNGSANSDKFGSRYEPIANLGIAMTYRSRMTFSERLAWWLTKLQNEHASEDFALDRMLTWRCTLKISKLEC